MKRTRITKSLLHGQVQILNKRFHANGYTCRLRIESGKEADWTDPQIQGFWRAKIIDENKYMLYWASPWLKTREMFYWLSAYAMGMAMGLMEEES